MNCIEKQKEVYEIDDQQQPGQHAYNLTLVEAKGEIAEEIGNIADRTGDITKVVSGNDDNLIELINDLSHCIGRSTGEGEEALCPEELYARDRSKNIIGGLLREKRRSVTVYYMFRQTGGIHPLYGA